MTSEATLRALIAKWRTFAATTFPFGTADGAERRGILAAERQKARDCADELEAALATSAPPPSDPSKETLGTTCSKCGHVHISIVCSCGCDISGELFRVATSAVQPEAQVMERAQHRDRDLYASYANHCAIQKKVPTTWHSWKREKGQA